MISTVWFEFTLIFYLCLSYSNTSSSFCKTPKGNVGKCIKTELCPFAESKCDMDTTCCALSQKIVTPDDIPSQPQTSAPPVTQTNAPPVTQTNAPPVTQTNAPPVTQTSAPSVTQTSLPPAAQTFPQFSSTQSTVEITTKMSGGSSGQGLSPAIAKCEEYKHRVKKRASIVTYVFGGTASLGKEFPHMALLGYGQSENVEWLCGGSLISDQYVLTAAHCLITKNLGDLIRVRLGELNLQSTTDDANPQDYGIAQEIVHPEYNLPIQYNDIALIKLDRQVQFTEYIAPICLQVTKNLPNDNLIATGWGRTESGTQSDTLLKVNLEYFPNEDCQKNYDNVNEQYLPKGILDGSQICAGSHLESKDTCQGDSGGPLQIRNEILYLVGITSFGKACGIANSPAVYTRVSYYVPWIEQIVWSQ